MMLPSPTLSFTLPSIHDDTVLDCRVYHPHSLTPSPNVPPWRKHAAVVAHPYAPLGGSYDDPVVDVVAEALLRAGFLVGLFNFRGAAGSAGRTSWTAKPEKADYATVVGFLIHYIHFLDPFPSKNSPATAADESPAPEKPVFLSAGYSYGAMVTTQLPPLDEILPAFESPLLTSAAADVRLRAQHLAEQQNTFLSEAARARTTTSPRKYLGMRVGGDEGEQRRSHEGKRSYSPHTEDKLRKGVGELLARTREKARRRSGQYTAGHGHGHSHERDKDEKGTGSTEAAQAAQRLEAIHGLVSVRAAYLLISPLQGMITHLATMSFFSSSSSHSSHSSQANFGANGSEGSGETDLAETKLTKNPTLAVYGDKDVFVSAHKLQAWAERLQTGESRFKGREVSGAGHFWVEDGAVDVMRDEVVAFAAGLVR